MDTEDLFNMIENLNNIVWGSGMIFLILCTGLYFTLRIKLFQLTHFRLILKNTFLSIFKDKNTTRSNDKHSISQFQALSTALAATMGTGNIIGVATAISIGGAGAIFWMWLSAFFGMAVIYAENVLGTIYRYKNEKNQWIGGPLAYLDRGLGCRWLAIVFAIFCMLASFGMGNMAQAHSISSAMFSTFNISPIITGVVVAILVGIIIIGGIKRIGSITQMLIPLLSVLYILASVIIVLINYKNIPKAFSLIFNEAFGISAIGGGISGAMVKRAINIGLRRGVFSNEAGLGSSALLHSASDTKSPELQGMWGIFEVFIDTIVCCTLTALVILTTGSTSSNLDGVDLVIKAFENGFGQYADIFITVSILLFAFATLVGWSYCGESSIRFIFGESAIKYYKLVFIFVIIIGATSKLSIAWTISDIFNGFMAIPNLVGILLLSNKIKMPNKRIIHKDRDNNYN